MSKAKAKIVARLIYKGHKTIDEYSKKDQAVIREAYLEIYGEELAEA